MPVDELIAKRRVAIQQMLQGLEHPYRELNAWELNFLESVSDQFTDRGNLTDTQFDVLEKLYEKKA